MNEINDEDPLINQLKEKTDLLGPLIRMYNQLFFLYL